MTDQNKSALEVIDAYKAQAKSRRESSALNPGDAGTVSDEHSVRQLQAAYAGGVTANGVTVSDGGKVTVSMKGCKPVSQAKVTEVFGQSKISIPEFGAHKRAMLLETQAGFPDLLPDKKTKKPSP
ncbi:MAG: hypothetical protein V4693_22150 [Pseudomonadota bacterium]